MGNSVVNGNLSVAGTLTATNIDALEANIATNASGISTNASGLSSANASIATNTSGIATNTAKLANVSEAQVSRLNITSAGAIENSKVATYSASGVLAASQFANSASTFATDSDGHVQTRGVYVDAAQGTGITSIPVGGFGMPSTQTFLYTDSSKLRLVSRDGDEAVLTTGSSEITTLQTDVTTAQDTADAAQTAANARLPLSGGTLSGSLTINGGLTVSGTLTATGGGGATVFETSSEMNATAPAEGSLGVVKTIGWMYFFNGTRWMAMSGAPPYETVVRTSGSTDVGSPVIGPGTPWDALAWVASSYTPDARLTSYSAPPSLTTSSLLGGALGNIQFTDALTFADGRQARDTFDGFGYFHIQASGSTDVFQLDPPTEVLAWLQAAGAANLPTAGSPSRIDQQDAANVYGAEQIVGAAPKGWNFEYHGQTWRCQMAFPVPGVFRVEVVCLTNNGQQFCIGALGNTGQDANTTYTETRYTPGDGEPATFYSASVYSVSDVNDRFDVAVVPFIEGETSSRPFTITISGSGLDTVAGIVPIASYRLGVSLYVVINSEDGSFDLMNWIGQYDLKRQQI